PQRAKLLETAIPFLEEFVRQQPDNPDLEAEQALAYGNLGYARGEMGDPVQALADFDRKEAIFARLVAAHEGLPELLDHLAGAKRSRAKVLGGLRRFDQAERALRDALGLAEKLDAAFPKEPRYRDLRATVARNLGVLLKEADRTAEALPLL